LDEEKKNDKKVEDAEKGITDNILDGDDDILKDEG